MKINLKLNGFNALAILFGCYVIKKSKKIAEATNKEFDKMVEFKKKLLKNNK